MLSKTQSEIEGVVIIPIARIPDDRGCVHKIKKPDWLNIADVYVTTVRQGAIKAWHGYATKTLYWSVVGGCAQLVLHDTRVGKNELTDTIFLGDGNNYSVLVPPGVYNGFKGISREDAVIVVMADEPYEYHKVLRLPYDEFGYDWRVRHG